MSIFIFKAKRITLSLYYDTLTVYSEAVDTDHPSSNRTSPLQLALHDCAKFKFSRPAIFSQTSQYCQKFLNFIKSKMENYDRAVLVDDDDHPLYHQDGIDHRTLHYHAKFFSILTHEQFAVILKTFSTYNVLAVDEAEQCLQAYLSHRKSIVDQLNRILIGDRDLDLISLQRYIKNCKNNDELVYIHQILTLNQYDYLRVKRNKTGCNFWHGSNAKNEVVACSKAWAMIEKTISLQMAHNIECVSHFSQQLAKERALQLEKGHRFFGIKRKYDSETCTKKNKFFVAFLNGDIAAVDQAYDNHFARYTT